MGAGVDRARLKKEKASILGAFFMAFGKEGGERGEWGGLIVGVVLLCEVKNGGRVGD